MIDVTDEDRISKLPDNVILRILSLLPSEETIRIGVLSRRWKSMWKKTRKLKFDSNLHRETFGAHVIDTLVANQNKEIDCVIIKVAKQCDAMDLAIMFAIASTKDVTKLVLILDEVSQAVTFPVGALNRQNTFKILKIMGNIKFNVTAYGVSFNFLKELHLYHVKFHNETSVQQLLRGCPVLEDLVVVLHNGSGIFIFTTDSDSLLRLTLGGNKCKEENFVIKTPRLRYMNIQTLEGVDSFRIEDASELLGVKISRHDYIEDENILTSVNSVESLSMSGPLKGPDGKIFYALVKLVVYTRTEDWCEILTSMLICSPKLEMLKMYGGWHCRGIKQWTAPDRAPDCLLFSLLTLEWSDIIWDEEDDINIATYILKNASQLKKATISTSVPTTTNRIQLRNRRIHQIAKVPRASKSCELCFEDASDCNSNGRTKVDPDVVDFLE